ncbi:MAG TPA: cytochrome c peroxidase [Myxococcales bacterium]|jgi:cytochrome c peroxidase|nr:cytochrome c peroxidase [Myxococcales bacterium]
MTATGRLACAALALCILATCRGQAPSDPDPVFTSAERAALEALAPAVLPPPPADSSNRWADDPGAALLGQRFFMDPLFSGRLLDGDNDGSPETLGMKGQTGRVSCAGCHVPASGFLDDRTASKQISLASGWNLRRTPSLLDVGQTMLLMWDGRHDTLYNQPFGPIENPTEMNSSRLFVAAQIAARYRADYEAVFGPLPDLSRLPALDAASTGCDRPLTGTPTCHGMPGDGAEYDGLSAGDQEAVTRMVVNLGKALGAYQRLLSCGAGRFDRFIHGEATALSRAEQRGASIFAGKGQCIRCHSGPYLSDQAFHNVGLRPEGVAGGAFTDSGDRGAAVGLATARADPLNASGRFSDGDDGRLSLPGGDLEGAFRTPTLRCVGMRPSFMHTGQLRTLEDVVAFLNRGSPFGGYPGTGELPPLGLTALEQSDLVAFLRALTGPGPAAGLLVSH